LAPGWAPRTEDELFDWIVERVLIPATEWHELLEAMRRALTLHRQPHAWRRLLATGMAQDFSWRASARQYLGLYAQARLRADAEASIAGAI